jgi:hypothetical protein
VSFEPGCFVGFDAVGGTVSAAKCVSLKTTYQPPYGLDFIRCSARFLGSCDKLVPDLDYFLLVALGVDRELHPIQRIQNSIFD